MMTASTENEYGCVRCQAWHGESDGPIYAEHIMHQSKHGIRRRPVGGWGTPEPAASAQTWDDGSARSP